MLTLVAFAMLAQKCKISNEVAMPFMSLCCLISFGSIFGLIALKNNLKKRFKKKSTLPDFENTPPSPPIRLNYVEYTYNKSGLHIAKPKPWSKPQSIVNMGALRESENRPIPLQENEQMVRAGAHIWVYRNGMAQRMYTIIP